MSRLDGYYYLHTNGDLIFKPAIVVESDPDYFDSDFVRKVWTVDTTDRGRSWIICIEALALGARENRIAELVAKWKLTDDDAHEFAKLAKLKLFKDGDQWCAAFHDFANVQESQVGFGPDCLHALAALAKQGIGSPAQRVAGGSLEAPEGPGSRAASDDSDG